MEISIGIVALLIAIWQLKLQRDEIRASSRLNALIHIAGLVREKIDHHERIISSLKSRRADWSGLATQVNTELRPMLASINKELIQSIAGEADGLDMQAICESLKLSSANSSEVSSTTSSSAAQTDSSTAVCARRVA